jgi:hypothetical protein
MRAVLACVLLACAIGGICWAARCTTVAEPTVLREYQDYVARAEDAMLPRFDSSELSWVAGSARKEASAKLASGEWVRRNISDDALNQRIAGRNGTVIHWIGAIRIRAASVATLNTVLEDYGHYDRIYQPMMFGCKAEWSGDEAHAVYDVVLGLHSEYRFASIFPQHFSFRVKGLMGHDSGAFRSQAPTLRVHLKASEIRESDSGVPGSDDFLEPYHDHGIMWALNAYWRARERADGLYFEFETITLARSVEEFACKIGFVGVPKSVISGLMDSLPADSVKVILEGTKAECERRVSGLPVNVSPH